jgi:hypothetical protein
MERGVSDMHGKAARAAESDAGAERMKADNGKRKEEMETLSVERLRGEGDLKAELSREGN